MCIEIVNVIHSSRNQNKNRCNMIKSLSKKIKIHNKGDKRTSFARIINKNLRLKRSKMSSNYLLNMYQNNATVRCNLFNRVRHLLLWDALWTKRNTCTFNLPDHHYLTSVSMSVFHWCPFATTFDLFPDSL